jgi:hypothetical protein
LFEENGIEDLKMQIPSIKKARQSGGLTLFTAVLVLFLMTLMLFYAGRVGVFEQRVSSNDMRQKIAFHAADAMIDQGLKYLLANAQLLLSNASDAFPDAAGDLTRDGWFASNLWGTCTADLIDDDDHPCGGDIAATTSHYYYQDPADGSFAALPLDTTGLQADSTARTTAILCFVDAATGVCDAAAPASSDEEDDVVLVMTLLAYGYADCTDATDPGTCSAEATIAYPVSSFSNISGAPSVPLVTKTTFPPTGTAEVVPNPNAGGVGVPLSVWSNNNVACAAPPAVVGSGNWSTCEQHEWYGVDGVPSTHKCNQATCSCTVDESISYTAAATTYQGIDIIEDEAFPCDLFELYFGYPRDQYEFVKAGAQIISDCNNLGPHSSGLIWVSGSTCQINANTVIGSPSAPVILISAASTTRLNGGAVIYGVLYVFDGEDIDAELDATGTNTIYGAAIVDANMGQYQGTFQVVYAEAVLADAAGVSGLGAITGGWRDFGLPELEW